jgi:iron complex transport system substrate-binding protein
MKKLLKVYLILFGFLFLSPGNGAWAVDSTAVSQRIISLSPHFTEILYDIGAQDQLVGVTRFCKFPPEAQKKAIVGDFYHPNYEKIISLKPDLVLLSPSNGKAADTLKSLHIPVWIHDNNRIEEVLETYDALGEKLGRRAQAGEAKARLERRLAAIRSKAKTRKKVSILFVVGHGVGSLQQIYAAGDDCFVGEMMDWVGGDNMLSGTTVPFPLVSKEQLLKKNPDVIVDSMPSDEATKDTVEEAKKAWAKLPSLSAVRLNHVYFLKQDEYLIPGPTMVGLTEYLSKIFDEVQKQK